MTASLLPADDAPGEPGAGAVPRLPKYYQVKRQLLELTAAMDAGSPVPPERELARSYGTSRTTVTQALAQLGLEGPLLRRQRQRAEAEETIETGLADPHDARLLEVDAGLPLLLLSRHAFDITGEPVEWAQSWYRGDRYKFVTRLRR